MGARILGFRAWGLGFRARSFRAVQDFRVVFLMVSGLAGIQGPSQHRPDVVGLVMEIKQNQATGIDPSRFAERG